MNFEVFKGIASKYVKCESSYKLSSDHSPILITITTIAIREMQNCKLHNNKINWDDFREIINH